MITQDEALAELRNLNRQLGLPEDDGIPTPMSQADAMAQLAQLDEELATLPMTFEEFAEKEQRDQDRPLTEKAIAFGSNLVEGAKDLARQGGEAFEETPWWMFNPIGQGFAYETMGDTINVGARDFTRFAKTLGAAVMDDPDKAALFGPAVYGVSKLIPEEGKLEKAYKRYRENFDYNAKVRPAMLESGEIEYPKLVSFSANFVDPFMALPALKGGAQAAKLGMKSGQKGIAKSMLDAVETAGNVGAYPSAMALRKGMKGTAYATGLGLKGVSQAGKLTEKVAGAPRRIASKVAEKIVPGGRGAVIGGQVVGAITGAIPMAAELGIAEGIGLIAKKAGMEMGEILTTLGQPASQKRFLYRLSTNQAVSPTTRKLANYAYAMNGTAGGDALFNMVANGISAGAINAGLAGLSGLSAEEAGMAGGAGFVAGGVIPAGQAGSKAGKSNVARDALSIDRHIKNKLTEDQRTSFKKLPEAAQLMLATLQESGIGAPKFMVMEPNAYLEMLNAERVEKGETPLDRAPAGHYEKQDRTIYVNSANMDRSAKVATEIAAHEVGHDFVYQSLGNDPAMLRLLLEKYEATPEDGTPFYFEYDADNNPVGDPVYLNDEAVTIASDYDRKQRGIGVGRNASKLAQEIGADQFAMMFSQDPNAFENFHPRLRRTLIDASRKLLSVLGVAEPMTGNPLSNPISKAQLNNPAIKRIFRNYGKARATELDLKGDLSEQSVLIEPKKGQTGEDRYVELFGGQGLSLRDAKNLVISNKGLVKEILAIKQRVKEEPKDTWYISKTGRLVGKDLNSPTGQEIYKLFTRNDPFGNVRNLLDALQEGVSQRIGIRFGYRSGTKGKYQNPFKIRDYAVYGFEVSPLSNRNSRPTLKVLGYDQAVVRHNIQVLAENKFIKNINDFMKDFEEQGQRALEDPEGRINPEGRKENELMTVAFGLKESAPQIANPRLRELLESKSIKKSFRGPDIEGMAGLTKGRDKALSFNYENIRDNYNPFRQASDQVFQPQQLQFDFSPPKAAQSLEAKPNFWKIYRIDPKGPRVYDEVADVLIQVGSPWMDGSIIESQAPLLGLEKGKLRQAMNRAHRRADRGGGKQFMPADSVYLTEVNKGNTSKVVDLINQEAKKAGYIKVLRVVPKGVDLEKVKSINHGDWVVPDNEVGHAYLDAYGGSDWKTRAQYAYVKKDYLVDQQTGFEKKQTYTIGDTRLDESTGKLFLDKKDIDPNGIKSADPIIYDANGDIIPPSKRFNQNQDKLFMPASEAGASKGKLAEAAKLWQQKGTDSPYFKKWFGKSKVVDENGEPLVVYHGTPKKEAFTEFKKQNRNDETSPHPWNELGLAFFSDNTDISNLYTFEPTWERKQTGSVYPVYLQMENPRKINYEAMFGFERGDVQRVFLDTKAKGHDGFKIERLDGGFDYVPFKPEQIKSATGNRGTFDAGESNILFMPSKGTSALDILKSDQKPEGLPKVPTILEIAEYFKKEFGNPIDYKKSTPEQNRLFEDLIYEEVLYAQELHPEAAGWYDENLSLALSVLEELDPSIKQPDNNFIFKSVLAATSDGNKVQPQFDQTWATYNNWKNTGEISGEFVGGDRISNIKNNLLRIEAIYQLMGGEGAGRWLSQKGTIGEIREAAQNDLGYTKAEASKIGTSELVDEVVPYAVILGPKLGSFFNNLYGDYSTFTMDRWFMRTVGRNTGTQVVPIPQAKINAAKQRLRDAVGSLTQAERKKIGVTKQSVVGNNAIKSATKLAGYFTKKQNRTGVSAEVDNLRRAANALNKFGKPLKEAPQNGAERRWLRKRLETVQSRLRDVGVNLENADLQALLWYNEKEIYEKLGYRSPTGSADYAGAAEALHARKAGKPSRSYAEGTGRVGEIGRSASEPVLGEKSPKEVNFLPAGSLSRQPTNRVQQQARSMPANRFMAPASMAKGELSERFR